jgi:uncharacterized membrane protein YkvI
MKKRFALFAAASVALLVFFVSRIFDTAVQIAYYEHLGWAFELTAYKTINILRAVFALACLITALILRAGNTFIEAFVPALLISLSLFAALLSLCAPPQWDKVDELHQFSATPHQTIDTISDSA